MSDIDLYQNSTEHYEKLQNMRPDYRGAQKVFIELALKYLGDKKDIVLADFCCGIGNNTKQVADNLSVKEATLIDTNEEFLKIATNSGIKTKINTVESDILKAPLAPENDVVISMFAYHHVPDSEKEKYIEKVQDALKDEGILLLGEIYTPDRETTLKYYKYLLSKIPEKTPELENFLTQTAQSEEYEYKVSRKFAHGQLRKKGFELSESRKIWPLDATFTEDVGTFVEVWQFKN